MQKTKKLSNGDVVNISNEYPISVSRKTHIPIEEHECFQTFYGEELELPLLLLNHENSWDDKYSYTYTLMHQDSVYLQKPGLSRYDYFDPEIIGLWDGNNITTLGELLITHANQPNTFDFSLLQYSKTTALQSQRINKSILRKNRIGPKELKRVPYFKDKAGRGLVVTHKGHLVVTTCVEDTLEALFVELNESMGRYYLERDSEWMQSLKKRTLTLIYPACAMENLEGFMRENR